MSFSYEYWQFRQVAKFERAFKRGSGVKIARGLLLADHDYVRSSWFQWMLFPEFKRKP